MIEEIDCYNVDSPTCPYCGYVLEDWFDYFRDGLQREAIDCHECGREFACEIGLNPDFTSYKVVKFEKEDLQGYVKPEPLTEDEKQFLAKGIK